MPSSPAAVKRSHPLDLRVPPLLVCAAFVALAWGSARLSPALRLDFPASQIVAAVCALAGGVVTALGVLSFRRARTTMDPRNPERTSALVVNGIYRVTRNPIYLGLLLLLGAVALVLRHPIAWLIPPAFVLYMNRFQIEPEEVALRARFGEEFTRYQSQVRRWL